MLYRIYIVKVTITLTVGYLFLSSTVSHAQLVQNCSQIWNNPVLNSQLFHSQTRSSEVSNSKKFSYLEIESPKRKQWILAKNHELNEKIKNSPNKKAIENWLRTAENELRLNKKKNGIKESYELSGGAKLEVISKGIDKPEEMYLTNKEGESTFLVSTASFSRKQLVHLVNIKASPNENYVAFVMAEKGSLDHFTIGIYDLVKMEVLKNSLTIQTGREEIYWFENYLYFMAGSGTEGVYKRYDVSQPTQLPEGASWVMDGKENIILEYGKSADYIQTKNRVYIIPHKLRFKEIIGTTEKFIYFKRETEEGIIKIFRITKAPKNQNFSMEEVLSLAEGAVDRLLKLSDGYLFVVDSKGARETLSVYNQDMKLIDKIDAPAGTSITDVSFKEGYEKISITLTSKVVNNKNFEYDLNLRKFSLSSEELLTNMFTVNGKSFESFIVETKSEDGRVIPMRITKLKDLPLDGRNPVYMNVYGGFGIVSGFYPRYNYILTDFLLRGGIIVDPALRGGNEFGKQWGKEAIKDKKINTFNDLIATSRYLVAHKYTEPRKIIIQGTSNGGLTVAGSALQSPKDFGLVIAVNGVQDLLNKESLDKKFYRGWSFEYGDSTNPIDFKYLSLISPVEKAKSARDLPHFFILNGRQDSRVNPAHSYKLAEAISEIDPSKVYFSSINNSGHWNASMAYQDLIGWRSNVLIWTLIYDHIGWHR